MTASNADIALGWQLKVRGLPPVTPEFRFSPPRQWRYDYAFVPQKVAVEIEGGTYVGGRHTREPAFELDCIKYAEAAAGWLVLRVTTGMVEDRRALALIERALASRRPIVEGAIA
jgi:very-short-patch-repair endonuclease